MQMNLATRTQRVLVYLIDYIILGALVGLIIDKVFYKIINFDVSIAQTALTMFTEELAYTLEYMAEGVPYDTTAMMQHFLTYFKYIFIDSIINIAFMIRNLGWVKSLLRRNVLHSLSSTPLSRS